MRRLFLILLALGAVSVGVVFALMADRAPEAPPPELEGDGRFQRVVVDPHAAPGGTTEAPRAQAPRGAAAGPAGDDGERVEKVGRVALDGLEVQDKALGDPVELGAQAVAGLDRIGTQEAKAGDARKGRGYSISRRPAEPDEDMGDKPGFADLIPDEVRRTGKITRLGARSRSNAQGVQTLDVGYLAENKDKNLEQEPPEEEAWGALDLARLKLGGAVEPVSVEDRPERFLPRMCYFENTYLGGNAAYQERLRRLEADLADRPHRLAALEPQPFDAPEDAGLRLTATLDRTHLERPGRVLLQVGLQGSRRFGWRRPPLDVVLLVDLGQSDFLLPAADALLKRLGPADRLAIVHVGVNEPIVGLADRRTVRAALARDFDRADGGADAVVIDRAFATASRLLMGSDDAARVPGTRTVVVLSESGDADHIERFRVRAQALAEQGVVTSVVTTIGWGGDWWVVANAGHGNLHHVGSAARLGEVMEAELASLARVTARLLRVNIRLAPGVEGIRVLGSRVLGQEEVVEVKAREVATDRNLSRALGVKADRGDDDDGIQTVIPYFYGGDSHVILVELWVEKPGAVAEISLKYKDMVNLENASARTSVALTARPRGETLAQAQVLRNRQGFEFAAALKEAARLTRAGEGGRAQDLLRVRAQTDADRRLGEAFIRLLQHDHRTDLVSAALALAADRRIGASP